MFWFIWYCYISFPSYVVLSNVVYIFTHLYSPHFLSCRFLTLSHLAWSWYPAFFTFSELSVTYLTFCSHYLVNPSSSRLSFSFKSFKLDTDIFIGLGNLSWLCSGTHQEFLLIAVLNCCDFGVYWVRVLFSLDRVQ